MKFTNKDLERFKRWKDAYIATDRENKIIDLHALVVRLEAAEAVIAAHMRLERETISFDNFIGILEKWRKVSGKDGPQGSAGK